MTVPSEATRQRRGAAVVDAVLHATVALVAERGYGFSVDDVARRAHVHKTSIYRRYATRAALVSAAVEGLTSREISIALTSDPLADLSTLAVSVAALLASPAGARTLRAVVASASEDEEAVTTARRFLAGRFDLVVDIVARAVTLGQLRAGTDPVSLWGAIVNPLHVRVLLGYPVTEGAARDLVDLALEGARVKSAPPL